MNSHVYTRWLAVGESTFSCVKIQCKCEIVTGMKKSNEKATSLKNKDVIFFLVLRVIPNNDQSKYLS